MATTSHVTQRRPVTKDPFDSIQGAEPVSDEIDFNRLRFLCFSPYKKGKSTAFIEGWPDTLVLDFERSSLAVKTHPSSKRLYIHTWAGFEKVLELLETQARLNKRRYKRVVFDTLDRFQQLVESHLTYKYDGPIRDYRGGKGGYSLIATFASEAITNLEMWGYGWTCLSHSKFGSQTDNTGEVTGTRSGIIPGFAVRVCGNADGIFHLDNEMETVKTTIMKGGKPVAGTKTRKRYKLATNDAEVPGLLIELGSRVPMPDTLDITERAYDKIKQAIGEGLLARGKTLVDASDAKYNASNSTLQLYGIEGQRDVDRLGNLDVVKDALGEGESDESVEGQKESE